MGLTWIIGQFSMAFTLVALAVVLAHLANPLPITCKRQSSSSSTSSSFSASIHAPVRSPRERERERSEKSSVVVNAKAVYTTSYSPPNPNPNPLILPLLRRRRPAFLSHRKTPQTQNQERERTSKFPKSPQFSRKIRFALRLSVLILRVRPGGRPDWVPRTSQILAFWARPARAEMDRDLRAGRRGRRARAVGGAQEEGVG